MCTCVAATQEKSARRALLPAARGTLLIHMCIISNPYVWPNHIRNFIACTRTNMIICRTNMISMSNPYVWPNYIPNHICACTRTPFVWHDSFICVSISFIRVTHCICACTRTPHVWPTAYVRVYARRTYDVIHSYLYHVAWCIHLYTHMHVNACI